MKRYLTRRDIVKCGLVLAFAMAAGGSALAQNTKFPERPITLIVPYIAGTAVDFVARSLGNEMTAVAGVPVIVENRPGAGEILASTGLLRSAADGYTLMMTITPNLISDKVAEGLPYRGMEDFSMIAKIDSISGVFVMGAHVPANNLPELATFMRANPGKIKYASSGIGSPQHLRSALLTSLLSVQALHVPFKGIPQIVPALLSGDVDFANLSMNEGLELVKAGKLKMMGVLTMERTQDYPDIPTMNEQGAKGYDMPAAHYVAAPKDTPPDVVNRLNQIVNEALARPAFAAAMAKNGGVIIAKPHSAAEATQMILNDQTRFRQLVKDLKIPLD